MPDFAVRTAFTATDRVSPAFSRMGRAANAFTSTLKSMLPFLGAAAIVQFANKASEAWRVQETAVANVEAGLKSTNNAIGLTSQNLQDMASASQKIGIFGDEAILQNATAQFLTFGNIGKENFDRIQRAALDVTAKLKGINSTGEDLRGVSIMMGKAMDDPIRGMGAMRRVGISFSQAEEIAVKRMVAMNNVAGAQRLMLQAIERQYGGTNEALRQTTAGMERAAQNDMGDTMELIGQQMAPLRQALFEFVSFILPGINKALPVLVGFLKAIKIPLFIIIGGFLAWKVAMIAWNIVSFVYTARILGLIGAMQYYEMSSKAITFLTKAWTAAQWLFNAAMTANPIGLIVIAIAALITYTAIAIKHWNSFGAAMMILLGPIGMVISLFKTLYDRWEQIKQAFTTGGIVAGLKEIGFAILDSLLYPIQQLLQLIAKIPGIGKYAAQAAAGIQGFREGNLNAPNKSATELQAGNTNVNVYSNGTEAKAEVTPRRGATVNMNRLGYQQ